MNTKTTNIFKRLSERRFANRLLILLKKFWLELCILSLITLMVGSFLYKPLFIGSFRGRWDCYLDSRTKLGEHLVAFQQKNGYYPLGESGSYYGSVVEAMELLSELPDNFELSVEDAGRHIIYKGNYPDPFASSPNFPGEKKRKAWYYHSASAEIWTLFRGYPYRYYVSSDNTWAVIISNGPDGKVELNEDVLKEIESNSDTIHDVLESLKAHAAFPHELSDRDNILLLSDVFYRGMVGVKNEDYNLSDFIDF